MRKLTPEQRRKELFERYVLSRRTMMGLMALACTPGLETLVNSATKPDRPEPPDNPNIPSLPQKDSPATQQERQMQLQKTREEYRLDLRLPNSPRVELYLSKKHFLKDIKIIEQLYRRK